MVDNTGKVGIGTASPLDHLHINDDSGDARILLDGHANFDAELKFAEAGVVKYTIGHEAGTDSFVIGTTNVDTQKRLVVDSAGNVGIGDANPQHPFKVHLTNGELAMFGSNGMNSIGQYAGIGLGQVLANSTTYQKVAIVAEGRSNGNYVSNLHFLVDTAADSGSAVLSDSKMMISGGNGNVGIGTANPLAVLTTDPESGNFSAGYNNYDGVGLFIRGNGTAGNGNYGPALVFGSCDSDLVNQDQKHAAISIVQTGTDPNETGLAFWTHPSATAAHSLVEAVRIDNDGGVRINNTSTQDTKLFVEYNTASTNVGAAIISNPNASASRALTVNIGSNSTLIAFDKSFSAVGSITTNGSSVAYNTSSDYRLKENVDYDFTALDRVAQLKPARFNFIADADTTVDGFIAHEVQDIIPEAVAGEKDAVDDEGNPDYQGIDQSKLVPLLTKAIQEQQAQIEILKTEIQELKDNG